MALVLNEPLDQATVPADVTVRPGGTDVVAMTATFAPPGNTHAITATNAGASLSAVYANVTDASTQAGNATVSATVMFQGAPATLTLGVVLGIGGSWVINAGNDTRYALYLQNAAGNSNLYLTKTTNGVYNGNVANTSSSTVVWTPGVWYTLTLYRAGAWLGGTCRRLSDSGWLTATGTWVAEAQLAVAGIDTAALGPAAVLPQVASYGGIALGAGAAGTPYAGNLSIRDQVTTLPIGPFKGMNVCPAFYPSGMTGWQQLWGVNYVLRGPGGILTQIDLAQSAGCNCIRIIGGLITVAMGMNTLDTYLSRLQSVIAYCQSQGLFYYLTEFNVALSPASPSVDNLFAGMLAQLVAIAQMAAPFPNLLGFDLVQEFAAGSSSYLDINLYNGSSVSTGTFAMSQGLWCSFFTRIIPAIRAVAPHLPLTSSFSGLNSTAGWSAPVIGQFAFLFDYIDLHPYYSGAAPPPPTDSANLYSQTGTSGKSFLLGEMGDGATYADGLTHHNALINAYWNNVIKQAVAGQPGCVGGLWWAAVPQQTAQGPADFGMWDGSNPAIPRPWEATYAGLHAQPLSLAGFGLVLALRTTANIVVPATAGDLDTVIGSGFSQRYPFWFSEVPGSVALLSNGIDPMQRWAAATGIMEVAGVPAPATSPTVSLTGTPSPQATGAFIYGFVRFYDNYGNLSDLSPIGQGVSGYSQVTGTTYTNVALPTGPYALKVIGRQLLRNTPGQATTFYVDLDTRDLTSTTFTSTNEDSFVQTQAAVPLLSATGALLANIHGFPPSWKSVTAAYLGRVFATGEVTYSVGNVVVTSYSKTVQGIGTNWPINFAGRHLFLSSPPGEYEIASVDATRQTLELTIAYNGPTNPFAIYGIRAPASEWRNIYYTPTAQPESWPPSYALSLQDDGDEITGLMQLGSFLYILEQQHIYRLTFLTDPAIDGAIFLSSRRGCLNQRMWVQAEATAYLFDSLGVHSFSGGNSEPISDPIQDLWRDNGNSAFVINWNADTSLWSASYNATHTTVRFFVAMTGSRYPRHAIAYNYRQNRWWIEEYARPVCSTTMMTLNATTRTLAGMDANNVCALDVGYRDGTRGIVPTIAGTVTAQSACSLTDAAAAFTAELVNLHVAIVQGRAKGQSRRILAVTQGGTRLAIQTPWNIAPATGDTYQVGAIAWSWQPSWFRILDDAEGCNARDVEVLFQPLQTGTFDVQICYNWSNHPRTWTTHRDGTATVFAGDSRVEINLTDPSGRGIFRMEGHRERYLDGDIYLSPQLSGYQYSEPVLFYRISINGVSKEE